MNRRAFSKMIANTFLGVASATVEQRKDILTNLTALNKKIENRSIGQGQLVELRHSAAAYGTAEEFAHFREMLLACALNPWLKSSSFTSHPVQFEAIVEIISISGTMGIATLLDYQEWDDAGAHAAVSVDKLTFPEWIATFKPLTRDDFLMALPVYQWYRNTGELAPSTNATPDPWIDARLRSTRGILFWTEQWIDLIDICGGVGKWQANRLLRDYLFNRASAREHLSQARYFSTGQTLLQIIEERGLGKTPWGRPDYLAGDWLYQHFGGQV